jgi:hypothetical protein
MNNCKNSNIITNSKSMQLGGEIKATTAACKIDL